MKNYLPDPCLLLSQPGNTSQGTVHTLPPVPLGKVLTPSSARAALGLDIRKNFSTKRVVRHWHRHVDVALGDTLGG